MNHTTEGRDPYALLAGVYDEFVVDPCFASWADFVTASWADDAEQVHRVLDVCCGTGLMAEQLTARGLEVTGLDASAAMLARARRRLGPAATLLEARLPAVPAGLTGPFDAIVSTYDGLNYLPPADLRATVSALAALLRPGGWLVFDVHAEAMLALARDNPVVLTEHEADQIAVVFVVDEAARTCRSIVSLRCRTDPGRDFVEEHLQYLHAGTDVRDAIVDAGLAVVGVFDEYTDSPAGASTRRETWIARRPGPRTADAT